MTKIILVRHGHSVTNDAGRFTGQLNVALSSIGKKQGELLSQYIVANYQVDAIYASDLDRAIETVDRVSSFFQLPINRKECLREIFAGEWQGKTSAELKEQYADDFRVWQTDIGNAHPTGGESVAEVQKRALKAVDEIVRENIGKLVVVVSHAVFIRTLICYYQGKSLDEMKNIPYVPNASVSELQFDGNGNCEIALLGYNRYLGELDTNLKAGF